MSSKSEMENTMNEETSITVAQAVELFGKTIFWNNLMEWPGDEHKEAEYPLVRYGQTPDDPDEPRVVKLIFESGEASVHVATMHPIRDEEDAENGITDYDVEFIEKLPVIMPALLSEIDRLRAEVASLSLSPKPEAAKAVACGETEQEMEWRCEYCNAKYAEYINGSPKCFMGEPGTASSVRLVPASGPRDITNQNGEQR